MCNKWWRPSQKQPTRPERVEIKWTDFICRLHIGSFKTVLRCLGFWNGMEWDIDPEALLNINPIYYTDRCQFNSTDKMCWQYLFVESILLSHMALLSLSPPHLTGRHSLHGLHFQFPGCSSFHAIVFNIISFLQTKWWMNFFSTEKRDEFGGRGVMGRI